MSDTYCPLPWIGLNILPTSIAPCCQWNGLGDSLEQVDKAGHSKVFIETRQAMLQGERVSGCQQCYNAEQVGAKSRRQEAIEQYGYITEVSTKILDVSFDNVCNLKCRGCCTTSSHLWNNDEIEIYGQNFLGKKFFDQDVEIDTINLEVINVSGGEPFLSKKFDRFAAKLLANGHAENSNLLLSTNGTVIPSDNVYQYMLTAKELHLNISIDGIGHMNTYFRSGANFDDCLKVLDYFRNIKLLRGNKVTSTHIHTTVTVYNVNLLKEMEIFFNKNFPEYELSHRMLYWPEQMCIRNLPEDYKQQLIPIVESFGSNYTDVVNELKLQGEDLFAHFVNFHNTLDQLRNESLQDSNLMLSNYISCFKSTINSKTFFLKQMDLLKCGT